MRTLTRLTTLLFASAALACGDKTVNLVSPSTAVAGTWDLQTFDGQSLPVDLGGGDELTATTLVLVANDLSSGSFTLQTTTSANGTQTVTGTYTLSGTVLTLVSGGTTITGSFSGGNTLTLSENGSTLVFVRQ